MLFAHVNLSLINSFFFFFRPKFTGPFKEAKFCETIYPLIFCKKSSFGPIAIFFSLNPRIFSSDYKSYLFAFIRATAPIYFILAKVCSRETQKGIFSMRQTDIVGHQWMHYSVCTARGKINLHSSRLHKPFFSATFEDVRPDNYKYTGNCLCFLAHEILARRKCSFFV